MAETSAVRRTMSATSLVGDRVRNLEGEDLGKLEEIMIDIDSGRIAYAVLSFGGLLGLANKLFAVPWQALQLAQEKKTFYLDIDQELLEDAPGFDRDHWPDPENEPEFMLMVHEFYGYFPDWASH